MKIKNVPVFKFEEPISTFSDDSRFIYMFMSFLNPLSLSIYDIKFNKYITLLPDQSVNDLLLTNFKDFEQDSTADVLFVDNHTLLIFFNHNSLREFDGYVLLTVVKLNFENGFFSIIDHKLVNECYSKPRLVKNDNQFLIVHTFATDTEEFAENDQFLGYFKVNFHKNQTLEILENRAVFDFDYHNSGFIATWHICNNKLWCIRKVGRTMDNELLHFNLDETNSKEKSVEIFVNDLTEQGLMTFQWRDNFLLIYYPTRGEFGYFDLSTNQWSRRYHRNDLRRTERNISEFVMFRRHDFFGFYGAVPRHFDSNFNTFFIDQTKKELQIVPFQTPPKLIDIAWICVLNNNLLDELNKKNLVIFQQFF